MKPDMREIIARSIHESYRTARATNTNIKDVTMLEWEKLPEYLRESNRQQADDISKKLQRIRCSVYKIADGSIKRIEFTKDEIETMSEMEHERWNTERFKDGWRLGKTKDVQRKISPYLVPWAELPEDVKEWDRETVRKIPELLAGVELEIRRDNKKT